MILILKLEPAISYSGVKELLKSEFDRLHGEKAFLSLKIFCDVDF